MADLARLDPVADTLRRWAAEPFVWGETDCALSVLHHAERVSGQRLEPAPAYSGQFGARRYALRRGGFLMVFADSVEAIGCERSVAVGRGTIGMIQVPGSGLTAALCVKGDPVLFPRWAVKGDRNVVLFAADPVIAWRVPCPRR